jgi:sulfite oxidase
MWSGDAIGNAVWSGVRLADVIRAAEPEPSATHVWFEGLDIAQVGDSTTAFGASIELGRALEDDVVLAFEMNREPLSQIHGAPLRVVVPGAIGARSVKWLARVTLADRESGNHFQARSYRLGDDAIRSSPLNSYICTPRSNERVQPGRARVTGYATAAGVSVLTGVELRIDRGEWSECMLMDEPASGAWSRWAADVELETGEHELSVRAHDSSGSSQQTTLESSWNPRGYLNNAIHSVAIRVGPDI